MTYDEKCLELAKHFLNEKDWPVASDDERKRLEERLAVVIQSAVEDFLQDME